MSEKLRAGVIGVGLLGSRHSDELSHDARVELVAVADANATRAENVACQYGCRAYSDYEQMLAKEHLDVVVVATPDPYHRDPVVACAQAKIPHILLQKPMATTVEDAWKMLKASKEAGSQIYLIFATRWTAANMATRYAIRSGLIGQAVYGETTTDDSITVPMEMWGGRNQTWASASSSAHFLHSHLVDRLRWFLHPAEVESVYAMKQASVLGYAPDLYDSFLFFDNGFKARVKTGWIHYIEGGVENRDIYNGARGQVINNISAAFGLSAGWRANFAEDVPLAEIEAAQQTLLQRGLASRIILREQRTSGWTRGIKRGLELELEACLRPNPTAVILDSIVEKTLTPTSWRQWQGDEPLRTGEDGLAQTAIVCAVVESAETGQVVKLK